MNRLYIIALVSLVFAGPMLGKASADWDYGGGGPGGGGDYADWTPCYYNGC